MPELTPIPGYEMNHGMSQDQPAHLGDPSHWWDTMNLRFRHGRISQTPSMNVVLFTPDLVPVTNLSGFNLKQLGIDTKGLLTINFSGKTSSRVTQPGSFVEDTMGQYRWAVVSATNYIYYVNPINKIIKYDGATCTVNYDGTPPNYAGRYMVNFYQHLVIANVNDGNPFPLRLAWSDIEQFDVFEPTTTNEADFYDIPSNPLNALYNLGITGMVKIADTLAIFTPGSIWNMTYVGFDNGVMHLVEQITGLGNWLPYAVVSMDRYALFISNEDFYVYDGSVCLPIGGPIRDAFFARLSTDISIRNRTWGQVETLSQEIRWFFPSTASTGQCDSCVVFNWQTREWYFETSNSVTAVLNAGGSSIRSIDQLDFLSSTINGLDSVSATIDGLDASGIWPGSIYALQPAAISFSGTILASESKQTDTYTTMSLESRDYVIADVGSVKELDTLVIDADVIAASGALALPIKFGWDVYISVRKFVADPVKYSQFGTWDGTDSGLKVSNARISGRVFRFKFVSKGLGNCKFYGFTPYFHAGPSEN